MLLSGRGAWRCSGLFGFVQVCSGCAGVERGDGGGVDGGKFCQPGVNLASTFVKFWLPVASAWLTARMAGRRRCGERGMAWHSCSGVSVAGFGGSGEGRWVSAWASAHQALLLFPFPNSSLPPFRGEVRWGVGCCEWAVAGRLRPDRSPRISSTAIPAPPFRHSCSFSVIPAQAGTAEAWMRSRKRAAAHSNAGRRSVRPTPHLPVVTMEVRDCWWSGGRLRDWC